MLILVRSTKKSDLETGKIIICLHVAELTKNRSKLSIYGKESGMHPLDLTILVSLKK